MHAYNSKTWNYSPCAALHFIEDTASATPQLDLPLFPVFIQLRSYLVDEFLLFTRFRYWRSAFLTKTSYYLLQPIDSVRLYTMLQGLPIKGG